VTDLTQADLTWTGDYIMDEVELGIRVACKVTIDLCRKLVLEEGQ
jgi:hypothetical protein